MSNNNKKNVILQFGLMMIFTVLTQILMLIKNSIIASSFGVSIEMDGFNFVTNIGTFIFSFIGVGITTILIPSYLLNRDNNSINTFISFLYSITFCALVFLLIFRNVIIQVLSSGSMEFNLLCSNLMVIVLLTQFLSSFLGISDAVFQSNEKFNLPKIIGFTTSLFLVISIIYMKNLTIYKYALIILASTIINVSIQFVFAKKYGFKFRYKLDFKSTYFRKMIKTFFPTVLSTGLYQLSLLTDSIISSNLGPGQISLLSYSNSIIALINSVFIANIMLYIYPKIINNIKSKNSQQKLFDYMIFFAAITGGLVVLFILLGKEGIKILYERGNFSSQSTNIVYILSIIYILSLPINTMRDLVYRYFYAKEDTFTPFKNSVYISGLNIFISIYLAKYYGLFGIVLGTSITSIMSFIMILIRFKRKFGFKYNRLLFLKENFRIILTSLLIILVISLIKSIWPIKNEIISIFLYAPIILSLYIAILYLLKSRVFSIEK